MRPLLMLAIPSSGHRGRAWLGHRQADPKRAALALDRVGADLPAHHVDHAAGDREAEAEALALARLVAPVEALEDPLDLLFRNTRPGVDHLQHDLPLTVTAGANRNGTRQRRVLEGVG